MRLRSGGPVMEVLKYVEEEKILLGKVVSNARVKCVWFDRTEGRKEQTFHQYSLMKDSTIPGNPHLTSDQLRTI